MDEPIKPRALVPTEHKPRMQCRDAPHLPAQWRCTWWQVTAYGPTMDAAYAEWHRRLQARREAQRLSDALERSEVFGVPMTVQDRHAAARMLERSAGVPW